MEPKHLRGGAGQASRVVENWLGAPLGATRAATMASQASRQAAKQKALEQVARLFGETKKKNAGKKGGGLGLTLAQLKRTEAVPGLEGLEWTPPAEKVATEKVYAGRTCFLFRPGDWPRRPAIYIVESVFFDRMILFTILCNCVTMAAESPVEPTSEFIDVRHAIERMRTHRRLAIRSPPRPPSRPCSTHGNMLSSHCGVCTPRRAWQMCEWVYLWVFTVELVIKMLAYGVAFTGEGAYLRDAWCQLDFVVVTLAWLPILFPSFGNYSAIRAVRALRPLRALKRVPGMPVLVNSILAALPRVGNVLCLCLFIFLVFAIVGVETFKGALHYRCASAGFVETAGHPAIDVTAYAPSEGGGGGARGGARALAALFAEVSGRALKGSNHGGGNGWHAQGDWDSGEACNPSLPDEPQCPSGHTCSYFDRNPMHDLMSFDNVPVAFISLLQAITFDDWTVAMYALMDAMSPWVFVYFVLIVMLGGFFVVNLFLAVIFEETISAQLNEEILNAAVRCVLSPHLPASPSISQHLPASPRISPHPPLRPTLDDTRSPLARGPRIQARRHAKGGGVQGDAAARALAVPRANPRGAKRHDRP